MVFFLNNMKINSKIKDYDLQGPYDIIIVGRDLINILGRKIAIKLLQKVTDALTPTGNFVKTKNLKKIRKNCII